MRILEVKVKNSLLMLNEQGQRWMQSGDQFTPNCHVVGFSYTWRAIWGYWWQLYPRPMVTLVQAFESPGSIIGMLIWELWHGHLWIIGKCPYCCSPRVRAARGMEVDRERISSLTRGEGDCQ